MCGCRGKGDSNCQLWRCSIRESVMGGSGGIGMGTLYVSNGGDGDSVGCYDEFVGGADVGDDRSRYGDRVRNLVGMFIVDMFFFE